MKFFASTVVLMAAFTLLAGCKSKPPEAPPTQTTPTDSTAGVDDATANIDDTDAAGPAGEMLSKRVIYFDFDNAEIRPEFREIVAAHAASLAKSPNMKVRLEGHADERGSREYNIGLGERRSQSVRRALMLQGVGDGQIVTVSYGEERPAESGSDEAAWAKNRRVELVYGN